MSTSPGTDGSSSVGCMAGIGLGLAFLGGAICLFILGAGERGHPALLVGSVVCLLIAGTVPLAIVVRQGSEDARAIDAVLARGSRVDARIVEVRCQARRSPGCRIIAHGVHPTTGDPTYFVGPALRVHSAFELRDRQTVSVCVDPSDPTRAVMDLWFLSGRKPVGWTVCAATLPPSHG